MISVNLDYVKELSTESAIEYLKSLVLRSLEDKKHSNIDQFLLDNIDISVAVNILYRNSEIRETASQIGFREFIETLPELEKKGLWHSF